MSADDKSNAMWWYMDIYLHYCVGNHNNIINIHCDWNILTRLKYNILYAGVMSINRIKRLHRIHNIIHAHNNNWTKPLLSY